MHLSTGVSAQFVEHMSSLILTTILANSAADKLMIYIFFFFQKIGFDSSCKLSQLEMSNPIFGENKIKYFKILSVENFTQTTKY